MVSGHFLESDFHIRRTGGAAGGRTWRMNPAVQSSGISSCFQVDVFVFYVFGSSSSSWDICVLPVSRPSRVCLINTSTRSLWILWTFTCSILTWTHSETLLGGRKEKFQKMSRTTWLRLQVWKQRQWCWVKVLYFHTWTQFNLQWSLILYTLY